MMRFFCDKKWRTLFALVIFEQLESLKAGSTGDELVREFGLVGLLVTTVLVVDLVVGVSRVVCG